jgi:hypothetical protein
VRGQIALYLKINACPRDAFERFGSQESRRLEIFSQQRTALFHLCRTRDHGKASYQLFVARKAALVSCLRNNLPFVAFKMGCRQGAARTHPRNGAVTEPQRRRQPIFNATLRAGTLWRFSGVARLAEVRAGRALAADIGAALAPWKIAKLSPANGKLFQRQDTRPRESGSEHRTSNVEQTDL